MKRRIVLVSMAAVLLLTTFEGGATAKTVGGCPSGDTWQLVTVASLGITPEEASGIASLDGNGDGWTCISPVPSNDAAINSGALIFRDNTVIG